MLRSRPVYFEISNLALHRASNCMIRLYIIIRGGGTGGGRHNEFS